MFGNVTKNLNNISLLYTSNFTCTKSTIRTEKLSLLYLVYTTHEIRYKYSFDSFLSQSIIDCKSSLFDAGNNVVEVIKLGGKKKNKTTWSTFSVEIV